MKILSILVLLMACTMPLWAQTGPAPVGPTSNLTLPLSLSNGGNGVASYPGVEFGSAGVFSNTAFSANELFILGWYQNTPFTITSAGLTMSIATADAAHNSDGGFYYCATPGSGNCTLIDDIGAQAITTTTGVTKPWNTNTTCTGLGTPSACCTGNTAGTCLALPANEPPGYYILAYTSTAATIKPNYGSSTSIDFAWFAANSSYGSSSNGVLPATIASPAFTPSSGKPLGALN